MTVEEAVNGYFNKNQSDTSSQEQLKASSNMVQYCFYTMVMMCQAISSWGI